MTYSRSRLGRVLACIMVASVPVAVRAQQVVGSWTVEYRTRALKVEAVDESMWEGNARLVRVKLKNNSTRPITAIAIDVEGTTSTQDFAWRGTPLNPSDTTDVEVKNRVGGEAYRRLRLDAVLFGDKGPDDGDPSGIHELRFARLGSLLEASRCFGVLGRLDRARLDQAALTELLASMNEAPRTLDEALVSLPRDPQLKAGLYERVRAASAGARKVFLTQVKVGRYRCSEEVRRLTQLSEAKRTLAFEELRRRLLTTIEGLRPLSERDMEVER